MRGLTVSHLIPLFMATFLFSLNCISFLFKISVSAECICNSPFSSFSSCLYIKPCEYFILLLLLCRAFHQHGMNKEINFETIGRKGKNIFQMSTEQLGGLDCGTWCHCSPKHKLVSHTKKLNLVFPHLNFTLNSLSKLLQLLQ